MAGSPSAVAMSPNEPRALRAISCRVGGLLALVLSVALQPSADATCLSDAIPQESRQSLGSLDGNGSVPFGVWALNWDSALLAGHVVKILAEEVVGYHARISGIGESSESALYATAGCHAPNDIMVDDIATDLQCDGRPSFLHHVSMEAWDSHNNPVRMRDALAPWPTMIPEDAGDMGYDGVDGIYVYAGQRREAYEAEGLALEYYRSYDAAWQRPSRYFDNYTSFDPAELKLCSESNFAKSAGIQTYLAVTGDHDGVVKNPDGTLSARCWHNSWWFAPACRGDPELCVPSVTAGTGWLMFDIMQWAAVHNMPVALTVTKTTPLWQSVGRKRCLPYSWQPDSSFIDLQPTIITFPPHNALERKRDIRTSMTTHVRLGKWLNSQLRLRAPRLRELVMKIDLIVSSVEEMLRENKLRGGSAHEEVACEWVRRSRDVWMKWIPVKTKCTLGEGMVGSDGSFVEARTNASACARCPAGRRSAMLADSLGMTYVCARCQPGRSQPSAEQSECSPCDAGTFADSYESRECQNCNFGEYMGIAGQSACKACLPTFITNFRGATQAEECICPEGSYRDKDLRDVCLPCKEGMTCPEGSDALGYLPQSDINVPLLKPGFWSSSQDPLNVFRCEDTQRCPGNAVPGDACAGKFESQGCASCQEGLVQSGSLCVRCAEGILQSLLFPVAPLLALTLVVILLYWSSGGSYEKWGSWRKGAAATFFITLNHYHAVAIIHGLDAISDGSSSDTFETVSALSNLLSLFKPQCSGLRSFMSLLVLNSHSPGIILLCFVVIRICSQLLGLYRPALRMEQNRLLNCYFSLILTFFARVVDMALIIFRCADNPNGLYTLVLDRSILCYQEEWNSMVVIGASACCFWCIGFCALVLQAIYAAPRKFHLAWFQTRWTFLFVRFRPDVHWWSLTIVAKGVLLNSGSVFIHSGVGQIYWILLVLLAYLYLLVTFRPWRHMINNSVDIFAHLSLCLLSATSFWLARDVAGRNDAQTGLVVRLLQANMALAALPLIPVAIGMVWKDRSRRAQDLKETDSRLIVNTLRLMSKTPEAEQLAFLKGLTEHDFHLISHTTDMLLMELDHTMSRPGYYAMRLSQLSRSSTSSNQPRIRASTSSNRSRTREASAEGESMDETSRQETAAPSNMGAPDTAPADAGSDAASDCLSKPARDDNSEESSVFSF